MALTTTAQMALTLAHRPAARPFLAAACNAAARRWLDHLHDWPDRRLAIFGQAGCGKSHLARAWVGTGRFAQAEAPDPAARPTPDRLVIDDADNCPDEHALLHLLNTCAEARTPVLLTGRTPPARWPVRLPDLMSRLRAIQSIAIDPPDDALLRALLTAALADRQLVMAEPVREWLLARLPRTAAALTDAVARLDQASLARQNALTIPLAAAALRDLLDPAPEFADAEATLPAPPA